MGDPTWLASRLDRLQEALRRLDHAEVAACTSELAEFRETWGADSLAGADLGVLLFQVREAKELTESASALYSGWNRIIAPPPAAYTPDGAEPPPPIDKGTLVVDA